jgi:hypothetical protein
MQIEPDLEPDMLAEYDMTDARPAKRFNAKQVALTPEVINALEEVIRDMPRVVNDHAGTSEERHAVKVLRKLLSDAT